MASIFSTNFDPEIKLSRVHRTVYSWQEGGVAREQDVSRSDANGTYPSFGKTKRPTLSGHDELHSLAGELPQAGRALSEMGFGDHLHHVLHRAAKNPCLLSEQPVVTWPKGLEVVPLEGRQRACCPNPLDPRAELLPGKDLVSATWSKAPRTAKM